MNNMNNIDKFTDHMFELMTIAQLLEMQEKINLKIESLGYAVNVEKDCQLFAKLSKNLRQTQTNEDE